MRLLLFTILLVVLIAWMIKRVITNNVNAAKNFIDESLETRERNIDLFRKHATITWLTDERRKIRIKSIGNLTAPFEGYLFRMEGDHTPFKTTAIFITDKNMTKEEMEEKIRKDFLAVIEKDGVKVSERTRVFLSIDEAKIVENKAANDDVD